MNSPPQEEYSDDMPSKPSLEEMFEKFRPRLRALIEMRIDRRIRARLDPSDVIQEAFADAVRRYQSYRPEGGMSPYLWLRFLTLQQLLIAHRKHLSVKARTATLESPLDVIQAMSVEADSVVESLLGAGSSPSEKAVRNEELQQLAVSIEQMDSVDREILVLRHFEQLEFSEISTILDMSYDAVSSRYRRSLRKLGAVLNRSQL